MADGAPHGVFKIVKRRGGGDAVEDAVAAEKSDGRAAAVVERAVGC